jgi:HlyD family secretion protein
MKWSGGKKIGRWLVTLLILAFAVVIGRWGYRHWVLDRVDVTRATLAPVVEAFYAPGTLLPDRQYPIKSSVDGVITDVNVDKGVKVKQGEVLAVVRADDYIMKLRQAKAELTLRQQLADEKTSPILSEFDAKLKAANEQLEVAQRENGRIQKMLKVNAASPADLDRSIQNLQTYISATESLKQQRSTRVLELQRDLDVARQAFDIAQWDFDRQTIKSPIDGQVLDRPVAVGTRVKTNDHLMQIADVRPAKLVMRAAVDEEDKIRVKPGQEVVMTLYSYPDRPFTGKVSTIYPMADQQRRTFEVDVIIDKPDEYFSAGMTGELAFIVAKKDSALVIPSQALHKDKVWVVSNGELSEALVEVGLRSVQRVEILSGLIEDQIVVVSPAADLSNHQHVTTHEILPQVAAGLNDKKEDDGFKGFN